ncbi:unnamed protein product, partial [Mesorhabditis spiculigera]
MSVYLRYIFGLSTAAVSYLWASRLHKAMASLTPLQSVEKISTRVTRILGQNPGPFTLQGTNTYLVGHGAERILIDAGEQNNNAYISELKSVLANEKATISSIVVTHWHLDHVGGLKNVIDEVIGKPVPIYKIKRDHHNEGIDFNYVDDGFKVSVDGATLKFIATPGHTADHSSIWLEEDRALFSGDCILGEGTSVFECLRDYMISLKRILELEPTVIYPGHGPVVNEARKKVEEYIFHRSKRENDIVEFMTGAGRVTSMDIVNTVYSTTPPSVRLAARNNVVLHLDKLIKDGRVEQSGIEYALITPSKQ